MIELNNVKCASQTQQTLVEIEQLKIEKGEFVVICGPSGSGKSSLLRMISGLIPELYPGQVTGDGTIAGQDLQARTFQQAVQEIGMVFQNPKTQFFTSDVYSELAFAMENYGYERHEMHARLEEMIAKFDLAAFVDRSMFQLSGGQKQLIALASAYMTKPLLFLLDEPSSNLDETAIQKLRQYLSELKAQGTTILIVEHRLAYLMGLVDRVLVMQKGKIFADQSAAVFEQTPVPALESLGLRTLEPQSIHELLVKTGKEATRNDRPQVPQTAESFSLVCQDVAFAYKKQKNVLEIADLTLHSTEITGLIGHNGAGKSTLAQLVTGLNKAKSGSIRLKGKIMKPRQLIQASFLVMQDVNLQLFGATVKSELLLKAQRPEAFEEVVAGLNLGPLLLRHPQSLSGGEKQRVAIACGILSGKKIMLFDEPTSGLDFTSMCEVSKLIQWVQRQGCLVLIITHDLEFLTRTCQRVLMLEAGRLTADIKLENPAK